MNAETKTMTNGAALCVFGNKVKDDGDCKTELKKRAGHTRSAAMIKLAKLWKNNQ